jgi:hypothetical protein
MKSICSSPAFWFAVLSPCLAAGVDYVDEVKPILAQNCYRCHGADQQKHGLRLDTARTGLAGGQSGPAWEPGDSANSLILRVLNGTHPDLSPMPYKREPLAASEIQRIADWIDAGATAPEDEQPQRVRHWAFVPPERPIEPEVRQVDWVCNPIDRFVLARLESEDVQPSPKADRITLIRRLSLDLIGLPPTVEEVEAFLADTSPGAYERLVERLLASPHYGERWGRHWLDGARYADSNGYSIDSPRSIWPYRDWVIRAMNDDQPFDRFVIEQLAGDLLPDPTRAQRTATGFHRNTQINEEGGVDPEQFRIESVVDRVDTTATVFLGLTMACAQCHDHKFDPLSQKEYYEFFAFLNNSEEPRLEVAATEELKARDALLGEIRELESALKEQAEELPQDPPAWIEALKDAGNEGLDRAARAALSKPVESWSDKDRERVFDAFRGLDEAYARRQDEVERMKRKLPRFPTTMVLEERKEPRPTYVHIKGDFTRLGAEVTPGVPSVLHLIGEAEGRLNRLDLAEWLVDPDNPLTARVTVNRIWQRYFGVGLVATENDFGTQGAEPTHPELLDWLATEFIRQDWSMKAIHRLIVNSAAYRQSSDVRPDLKDQDPNNRWLARQNRLRLDAEIVRDVALRASGLLSEKIGGPGVHPPQPDGVMNLGQRQREWKADTGADRFRRGMYTFFWRATPHPALAVFDAPDSFSTCTRRLRSNTPLQALTLLNDRAFHEFAMGLGRRVLEAGPRSTEERLAHAFRLCLAREPAEVEQRRLRELLEAEMAFLRAEPGQARELLGENAGEDPVELAAWTLVSRVLLNLDETITRE